MEGRSSKNIVSLEEIGFRWIFALASASTGCFVSVSLETQLRLGCSFSHLEISLWNFASLCSINLDSMDDGWYCNVLRENLNAGRLIHDRKSVEVVFDLFTDRFQQNTC